MLRKLLATTALVTVSAGLSFAAGFVETSKGSRASELIGETVYTSDAKDAETIGEIEDFIVGENGGVDAVIIGVGGFLGVGEKDIAVSFRDLKWEADANGDRYAILETTKEELNKAPAFEMAAEAPATKAEDQAAKTGKTSLATDQTAESQSPADRKGFELVEASSISAEDLIDTTVYSSDERDVGEVNDVILAKDGKIDAVVIDVGGFLGMGEKPIAMAFEDLQFKRDSNGILYVYSKFTQEQLEAAPEYVKDEYEAQRDTMRVRSAE